MKSINEIKAYLLDKKYNYSILYTKDKATITVTYCDDTSCNNVLCKSTIKVEESTPFSQVSLSLFNLVYTTIIKL